MLWSLHCSVLFSFVSYMNHHLYLIWIVIHCSYTEAIMFLIFGLLLLKMDFMYFVYFMCVEVMCVHRATWENSQWTECFTLYKYIGNKKQTNKKQAAISSPFSDKYAGSKRYSTRFNIACALKVPEFDDDTTSAHLQHVGLWHGIEIRLCDKIEAFKPISYLFWPNSLMRLCWRCNLNDYF